MTLTRKTLVLLGIAVGLGGILLLGEVGEPTVETLPSTPQVLPNEVRRVVIASAAQRLVMERAGTDPKAVDWQRWVLREPIEGPADAAQVSTLLRAFAPGVPMVAEVGKADPETYGFGNDTLLTVELFKDAPTPAVSLLVGKSAGGPAAFVRLPGSDVAYRADVGGRARFERPAADWRDKVALEVPTDEVTTLTLTRDPPEGREVLRFARGPSPGPDKDGNPQPGAWGIEEGAPEGFVADDATIGRIVGVVASLRAGMIHNPDYQAGFGSPAVVAELALRDGSRHTVVLGGQAEEGAAFVKVDDRPEVFRVSAQVGRVLTLPVAALRDRTVLAFDPATVASATLSEGGLTVMLEQSGDGARTWTVAQPANMDADQTLARKLVEDLSTLRADGLPDDGAFTPSGGTLTLRFRDGTKQVLELGALERDADNRPLVRVRVGGRVFQLKAVVVAELRRAFGRG